MKKIKAIATITVLTVSLALGESALAAGFPWRDHAPPYDFRFGNNFDMHQQSKLLGSGHLQGFQYIEFTGSTSLGYFDAPGNAEVGRRLFTQKQCVSCHQVGGVGGIVGPNLDHLRQFGSPIFIATAMWNHGPAMAEAMRARSIERPTFTPGELRDLIAFLAPASGTKEGPVYVLPGRAANGRRLFAEKGCVQCHAVGGQGGHVGPDLVERAARRSLLELATAMWNKAPAMTTAMKARSISVPQLRADEMADIVAYLYSVGYFGAPGGVQRGWKVALDKGCLVCHGVAGERGKPASDLSKARNLDSPASVLAALWNHAVVTAPTPGSQRAPWPEFRADEMADLVTMLQSVGRR